MKPPFLGPTPSNYDYQMYRLAGWLMITWWGWYETRSTRPWGKDYESHYLSPDWYQPDRIEELLAIDTLLGILEDDESTPPRLFQEADDYGALTDPRNQEWLYSQNPGQDA